MDLVSGELFWTKINKVKNKYTYLSEDKFCDVVVVGGGITGAICAYYLVDAGMNVTLVDRNILGYESTRASTSILQYEIDNNLVRLQDLVGIDNAVKCFKLCEKAIDDIESMVKRLDNDCRFTRRDCLYFTNSRIKSTILKKEFELRKTHGFNVEFLDKQSSKDRFSFPMEGGIYSINGAGEIDPYLFTVSLINYCIDRGLKVYENTEIVEMLSDSNQVILRTKNGFTIKAHKAVLATGFEARKLIKEDIVDLTRSFTLVTNPVKDFSDWLNKCIIRDFKSVYTYLRTTNDNRIMIGGEDMTVLSDNGKTANLQNTDTTANKKHENLENALRTMFPSIPDIKVEYKFSGIFGNSKDSLPYIGEYSKMPGYYFCLGYGSNGILYAIFGAQIIRDVINGKYEKEYELFRIER